MWCLVLLLLLLFPSDWWWLRCCEEEWDCVQQGPYSFWRSRIYHVSRKLFQYLCMYVCMYVCIYVYVCIIHTYIHTYIHHVCVCNNNNNILFITVSPHSSCQTSHLLVYETLLFKHLYMWKWTSRCLYVCIYVKVSKYTYSYSSILFVDLLRWLGWGVSRAKNQLVGKIWLLFMTF